MPTSWIGAVKMPAISDTRPASEGWYWRQSHWDNFVLIGPGGFVANFRDYPKLCIYCGFKGINAAQA